MGLQRGAVSAAAQRHGVAKHSEMRGVGALGGAECMQVRRRGGRGGVQREEAGDRGAVPHKVIVEDHGERISAWAGAGALKKEGESDVWARGVSNTGKRRHGMQGEQRVRLTRGPAARRRECAGKTVPQAGGPRERGAGRSERGGAGLTGGPE